MQMTLPAQFQRTWIDAQLPPTLANWLTETFGLDGSALRDLGLRDAQDIEIFAAALHQFPHQEIERVGTQVVDFNDRQIRARWDSELETVIVEELDGTRISSSTAFAFVYPAFFPE